MFRTILRLLSLLFVIFVACGDTEGQCIEGECVNADVNSDSHGEATEAFEKKIVDPICPGREHVILCAGLYLDTNKNGLLERQELQSAIDTLPWYGSKRACQGS